MLMYHNLELKWRFFYSVLSLFLGSVIVFNFKYTVLFYLCPIDLMFTELYEGFSCLLWLSFCVSLMFSLPYVVYSCSCFLSPGLYSHEQKRLLCFLCQQTFLFFLVLSVYVYVILPLCVLFFISFMTENLVCSIKLLDFVLFLSNLVYLSLGTTFLVVLGFHVELSSFRKWIYSVLLFVIGLLTPPDVVSLLLVWSFLVLFLELGYYVGLVLESKVG